ncbi:MAG: hypothetical protein EBS01_07720 [Verrucomicrobia bacterium]|nr:hypothetical protein [Verrucomicrobiota bacterium]
MNLQEARWESEGLYLDGDAFYAALISEMESATHSVDMEVYSFEAGVLADRLCETFQRAHSRGVRVRLIFDHWGSPGIDAGLYDRLVQVGVQIRIFRGLPWKMRGVGNPALRVSLGEWVRQIFRRIRTLNRGFHRKVTIVDGTFAWVSSLNVSDVHLREVRGRSAWADAGVRVSGPEVRILSDAFKRVFGERVPATQKSIPSLVVLNDSRFSRGRMNRRFREKIELANTRVWIQTPYFLPPRRILRALCRSARRGTDVRIMVPVENDYRFIRWMSLGLMGVLLKSGVRVMEYHKRFSHKKVLIVDQAMFLGSVNVNYRSFLHDLEVEVALTHSLSMAELEASFLSDEGDSHELTPARLRALPLWLQVLSRLLFFFRYWC